MNTKELGHRIKEARIAKKMTQSQVVGDFITRNMLSQIENGTALPSVKTLKYLADVLNIPDILDFSSDESEKENVPAQEQKGSNSYAALAAAKAAVLSEDWSFVIAMEKTYPSEFADEFAALLARSFLAAGKSCTDDPARAMTCMEKAMSYADLGIYANASLKAEAVILLQQLAASLTIPDPIT
ncbi:MAG: helix-turn-helix transcriptional regulator [Firmicutes bacterium]|nr:helix-turn-helix transcriptional regulator [Bacillota bacterium]